MSTGNENPLHNGSTLDTIFREWARAQIQMLDIRNYNGAMLAYNHQADTANRLGLDDKQKLGVTPFPSPTTSNLHISQPGSESPPQAIDTRQAVAPPPVTGGQKPKSSWLPVLGAALLSGTLVGGTAGTTAYMMSGNQPQVQQEQPATQQQIAPANGTVGVEVEGWPEKIRR